MLDRSGRFQRFLQLVEKRQLDGFVVSHPVHLDYLFNFRGSAGLAAVVDGQARLIVDSRYLEAASAEAVHCGVLKAPESIEETLRETLAGLPAPAFRRSIGFESNRVSHEWALRVESWDLAGCRWTPVSNLIEEMRAVKEAAEIEILKEAFQIAQAAYRRAVGQFSEGMPETEAAGLLEIEMRRGGGQGAAFDTIVASGPRSALPHGVASQRRLRRRETVLIDFGIRWRSYHSDLTRLHQMSGARPPDFLPVVQDAWRAAMEAIRPGVLTTEVDEAARRVIRRAGYADFFGHGVGHGLGLEIHELPKVSPRNPTEIREGMVFTIEPGIYLPGQCGVRIEDAVAVTATKSELLSTPEVVGG